MNTIKTTSIDLNSLPISLKGEDETTNIVGIKPLSPTKGIIYRRIFDESIENLELKLKSSKVVTKEIEWNFWFLVSSEDLAKMFSNSIDSDGERIFRVTKLIGDTHFKYYIEVINDSLIFSDIEGEILRVFNKCFETKFESYWKIRENEMFQHILLKYNNVESFMIQKGITHFKDMDYTKNKIICLDIETTSLNPEEGQIFLIVLYTNYGKKFSIWNEEDDEKKILETFVKIMKEEDADIIVGHNFFHFDLNFIKERADRNDVKLSIGRMVNNRYSDMYVSPHNTVLKVGEGTEPFNPVYVNGRDLIDTMFLAKRLDSIMREMNNYQLKYLAKDYFDLYKNNENISRTYIDGAEIYKTWLVDREKVLKYCYEDTWETMKLFEIMISSYYCLGMLVPSTFQKICHCGTSTLWDLLLVREYLRLKENENGVKVRHTIPLPQPKHEYPGGYVGCEIEGMIKDVYKCDFGCVDEETLILTNEGWKKYDEVKENEVILTYNINKKELEYQVVDKWNQYDYNGKMYHFKGSRVDQLVTPNHRCYISRRQRHRKLYYWRDYEFKNAEDVGTNIRLLVAAPYKSGSNRKYSNEFVKLLGWIITEGWYRKLKSGIPFTFSISQSEKNIEFVDEIRYCLEKEGFGFTERKRIREGREHNPDYEFHIRVKTGKHPNMLMDVIPNKRLTRELLELPYDQLYILWETMIKADGSSPLTTNNEHKWYYQSYDKENLLLFQELTFKLGYKTKISDDETICHIQLKDYDWVGHKLNGTYKREIEYKGVVWCPTVKNLTFVAKRNNKIFITGNSLYPSLMLMKNIKPVGDFLDVVIPMLRYMTNFRLNTKHIKEELKEQNKTGTSYYNMIDGLQSSLKIFINSLYGVYGSPMSRFNNPFGAEDVTISGQHLIKQVRNKLIEDDCLVIAVDTDGINFSPSFKVGDVREYIKSISDSLPQGINLDCEDHWEKIYSYKKKSYALLEKDKNGNDKIKIKGAALRSSSKSKYINESFERMLKLVFRDKFQEMKEDYVSTINKIRTRQYPISEMCTRTKMKTSTGTYKKNQKEYFDLNGRFKGKQAHMELLIQKEENEGSHGYKPGDKVHYYILDNHPTKYVITKDVEKFMECDRCKGKGCSQCVDGKIYEYIQCDKCNGLGYKIGEKTAKATDIKNTKQKNHLDAFYKLYKKMLEVDKIIMSEMEDDELLSLLTRFSITEKFDDVTEIEIISIKGISDKEIKNNKGQLIYENNPEEFNRLKEQFVKGDYDTFVIDMRVKGNGKTNCRTCCKKDEKYKPGYQIVKEPIIELNCKLLEDSDSENSDYNIDFYVNQYNRNVTERFKKCFTPEVYENIFSLYDMKDIPMKTIWKKVEIQEDDEIEILDDDTLDDDTLDNKEDRSDHE